MYDRYSEEAALITRITLLRAKIEHSTEQIRRELEEKYSPNQPRVPRGNPDGGQWTDTGSSRGGAGGNARPRMGRGTGPSAGRPAPARESIQLPRRKPSSIGKPTRGPRHVLNAEEVAAINRNAPRDTPPEDLEVDPMFGVPRWMVSGRAAPAVSPLDVMGAASAARAVVTVGRTSVAEATSVISVLRGRVLGRPAIEEGAEKIRRAADAIEDFLGGRPDPKDVIVNKNGDIVIMRANKKFRMDVKNPGTKQDRVTPDDPHFHLQRFDEREGWVDATDGHRNYFKKD